jgi:hypothetical protein
MPIEAESVVAASQALSYLVATCRWRAWHRRVRGQRRVSSASMRLVLSACRERSAIHLELDLELDLELVRLEAVIDSRF